MVDSEKAGLRIERNCKHTSEETSDSPANQTSDGAHQHVFLYSYKVESTIPHPRSGWSTLSFKKGAPFRKLSFYRLWHSAQLSYKDIIKRDFLFSGKSHFIFILVHMSRTDLPFQLSILATQPGLISGTSPRICM